jgi:hypothetical protein
MKYDEQLNQESLARQDEEARLAREQQLADLESQRSYAAGLLTESNARADQQDAQRYGVPLPQGAYQVVGNDPSGATIARWQDYPEDRPGGVRPPNPSESLRDMVLLDKLIKETGTRDIGTPTMELRQGQDKNYSDIPSSGGAGLITYRQLMSLDSAEAALNAYNGALADSSAGRGYMGISDLPNGALPIDMRQNAWRDVVAKQPTYSSMEALPNFFNVPPGWQFMANDPNTAADDTYKKVNKLARDEEMPILQFIAQKAIPKTNEDGDIAWRAFRNMFKEQYGKDLADIISGKTPPPAPGRVVGSAGASTEAAAKVDLLLGGGL